MSQNCRRTSCGEDVSQSVQPSGNPFEICSQSTLAGLKVEGPSWACTWSLGTKIANLRRRASLK